MLLQKLWTVGIAVTDVTLFILQTCWSSTICHFIIVLIVLGCLFYKPSKPLLTQDEKELQPYKKIIDDNGNSIDSKVIHRNSSSVVQQDKNRYPGALNRRSVAFRSKPDRRTLSGYERLVSALEATISTLQDQLISRPKRPPPPPPTQKQCVSVNTTNSKGAFDSNSSNSINSNTKAPSCYPPNFDNDKDLPQASAPDFDSDEYGVDGWVNVILMNEFNERKLWKESLNRYWVIVRSSTMFLYNPNSEDGDLLSQAVDLACCRFKKINSSSRGFKTHSTLGDSIWLSTADGTFGVVICPEMNTLASWTTVVIRLSLMSPSINNSLLCKKDEWTRTMNKRFKSSSSH